MPEAWRGRWVKPEARTLLGSRPESPRYAPVARADEDPLRTSAPAKSSWLSWKLSLPLACLLAAVALLAAGYRFPTFAPAHHDTPESAREFSAPRAAHAHSPEAPSRREEEALLRALVLKHHASRPPVDGASATRPADASRDETSKGDRALTLDERASRAKTKANADGAADSEASSEPSETTAKTGKAETSAAKETTSRGRRRRRDDVAETGESKTHRRAASKRSSETSRSRHANVEDAKRHSRGHRRGHRRRASSSEPRDDRSSAAKVGDTKRHHHEHHPHEYHHHHARHHHHAASSSKGHGRRASSAKPTWSVDENGVLVTRPATFAALGDATDALDAPDALDARPAPIARLGAEATAAAAARGEATGREVGEAMVADIAAAAERALDDGGSSRRRREDARRETTDAARRVASVAVDPAGEAVRRGAAERTAGKTANVAVAVSVGAILADLEDDASDDELVRRVAALSSLDDE